MKVAVHSYHAGKAWLCICVVVEPPFSKSWIRHCASTVWSPWQRYLVDDVEKVQRRSARYIYNDYRSDSSVPTMIENLHWDSLETRRTKSSLVMFYKMINNLAAIPYEHYVKPIPNSTTRHSSTQDFTIIQF